MITEEDLAQARAEGEIAGFEKATKDETGKEIARRKAKREADRVEAEEEEAEAAAAGEIPLRVWDLKPYLDGEFQRIAPLVLRVTAAGGDHFVLYRGRVNWTHGTSGSGKTLVTLAAVAQELIAGGTVLWIEYEEVDPQLLCERLTMMGVPEATVDAQLVFVTIALKAQPRHIAEIVNAALAKQECGFECVSMAVIDSVGEAFGVEGINENSDAEVAPWINRVLRSVIKKLPESALVVIDHGVKDSTDSRAKWYPSGSKRKRAAVTGISILVEGEVAFSAKTVGNGKLLCAKDRMGNYAFGEEIGIFTVDGTHGDLRVEIRDRLVGEAPAVDEAAEEVRTPLNAEQIWQCAVQAVAAAKAYTADGAIPLNATMLKAAITYKASATAKAAAVSHAILLGAIERAVVKNAHDHRYVRDLNDSDREFIFGSYADDASPNGSTEASQ